MYRREVLYHSELLMSNGRSEQELIEEAKAKGLAMIKEMRKDWKRKPCIVGTKSSNNNRMHYSFLPPPPWRVRTTLTAKGNCRLEIGCTKIYEKGVWRTEPWPTET